MTADAAPAPAPQTTSLYLLGSFEALEAADDQTSQTTGLVLRFLPFMLGWFAMNAPAGLGLYWVFNNVLTTVQTVAVKKIVEKPVIDIPVDLAVLGPRRDPLPLPDVGSIPDWVPTAAVEAEAAEAGAAVPEAVEAASVD